MTFPENDDSPIPVPWLRLEISRADYIAFMSTVERLMGAMEMIGQWNGSIKPFVKDPREDAVALLQGMHAFELRMEPIDAPPELPVTVVWEMQQKAGEIDGVTMWTKVVGGHCDLTELSKVTVPLAHGFTYRFVTLDDETGEVAKVVREFTV